MADSSHSADGTFVQFQSPPATIEIELVKKPENSSPLDEEKTSIHNVSVVKLEVCEEVPSDQEKIGLPVIASVESHAQYSDQWSEDESKCLDKFIWRHKEIQLLIYHYKCYRDLFKSGSMKKKDVWQKIAKSMQKHGHNVTGEACDKKWRNLLSTYKGYVDKNRVTGCGRRNWQYYDQFHELYQKANALVPDVQTRRKVNVGVQTITQATQNNPVKNESTCSFTTTLSSEVVMLPLSTYTSDSQSSTSAQRKKSLETDDQNPVLEVLRKKHKSDALWQLQVKELLFKNIKVQEETNEAINRLTEVLLRYIHEH